MLIAEPIDLTPFAILNPALKGQIYPLPVRSVGNPNLQETSVDAFEIGYTGVVAKGKAVVTAAVYVNRIANDILFTEDTSARYGPTNPPPAWPLPPFTLGPPFLPNGLPARFTYLNFGRTIQKGLELGVTSPITSHINAFANYSYQPSPDVNFDLSEVNLPPKNRFNIGFNFSRDRYMGDFVVAYTDSAYWQDVLDARYHGTTDPYTLVNGGAGVRWANNKLTTSVKVINLFNQTVIQHVFGDIIKRQVVGELKVQF